MTGEREGGALAGESLSGARVRLEPCGAGWAIVLRGEGHPFPCYEQARSAFGLVVRPESVTHVTLFSEPEAIEAV